MFVYRRLLLALVLLTSIIYDFESGWGGLSQNVQNGTMQIVNNTSYDGLNSVLSVYNGNAGGNGFARVLTSVSWNKGDLVCYGGAFRLQENYYDVQGGEVSLMRWDNWNLYGSGDDIGGLVIWASDHMARVMQQVGTTPEISITKPFYIPSGEWHWLKVCQTFGVNGINDVYMDDVLMSSVVATNMHDREITRIRFGLVAIDQNRQAYPISLHFDHVYLDMPSPSTPPTDTPTATPILTPTPECHLFISIGRDICIP